MNRNILFQFGLISIVMVVVGMQNSVKAENLGEQTVKTVCTGCHRIEGRPMPRDTKQAPDLIWAGNKYQSQWLETWLQNPQQRLYPLGYDYNGTRKGHLSLSAPEAKAVTQFLETLIDPRVKKGVMKPGTPQEIEKGKKLYQEHACSNCHWTPAKNRRRPIGGNSSTSFVKMGSRLQADWVYRFNLNPNDFVPDSGAYIPKPPLPEEDIYAITAYMMTFQ
jgi:mono/diheme cytochrome c family protein